MKRMSFAAILIVALLLLTSIPIGEIIQDESDFRSDSDEDGSFKNGEMVEYKNDDDHYECNYKTSYSQGGIWIDFGEAKLSKDWSDPPKEKGDYC